MPSHNTGPSAFLGLFVFLCVTPCLARADPEDFCARVRTNDQVRPYDPELRPGFVRAFKLLFPKAVGGQSDPMLRAQAVYRCMGGRLLACFIGANLPCGKIDRSRANPGAAAFCRDHPEATDVPRFATGASEFTFRCQGGTAFVSGTAWSVDERGFARDLWAPMNLD